MQAAECRRGLLSAWYDAWVTKCCEVWSGLGAQAERACWHYPGPSLMCHEYSCGNHRLNFAQRSHLLRISLPDTTSGATFTMRELFTPCKCTLRHITAYPSKPLHSGAAPTCHRAHEVHT